MVEWGSVKLPELEYRQRDRDPAKSPPEPGLVHLPTGLRMESVPTRLQNRGEWREYMLYSPPGEDWRLRLRVYGWIGLHRRIEKHLGLGFMDLSYGEGRKLAPEFLRKFGQEYVCDEIIPEPGSAMPDWTEERRDAVVMLLFYILEVLQSIFADGDPCPSTIKFMEEVPDIFIGTYR
ncbi:MAG: hypothetical protein CSA74_00535, partial [Rhodobacterales bacterium]